MTDQTKLTPLSNAEIAARLLGFYERFVEPQPFAPKDVVRLSPGITPSGEAAPHRNSRFAIVMECAESMRKVTGSCTHADRPAIFISYMDSDGDACLGWTEAWRYQKVTPEDYRAAGLNG